MLHRWKRELRRNMRRSCLRRDNRSRKTEPLLTLMTAMLLAGGIVSLFGLRIRPLVATAARAQAENTVNRMVEEAVFIDLQQRGVGYSDFVTIQRDNSGAIIALTTDMAAMNRLRGRLLECVLEKLDGIQMSDIQIPLSSLLDLDFLWATGPKLKIRSMSVGTVSAEFESEFQDAGVNQTIHRIWLQVTVPLKLILPGERLETQVDTRLCVAETVIVGQVPDAYLQKAA